MLKPGDIFLTRNPMWMGRVINAVQKFTSKDGKSKYSHAGIITSIQGMTFEALWINKSQSLFKAYAGKEILIARHTNMTADRYLKGWNGVKHHMGKIYAGHRLLFFLICPPLAKYFSLGLGVCSELTMKFLFRAGLADAWKGWNPDDIHDMISHWKQWEIIFEGICPKTLKQLDIELIECPRPLGPQAQDKLRAVYQNRPIYARREVTK